MTGKTLAIAYAAKRQARTKQARPELVEPQEASDSPELEPTEAPVEPQEAVSAIEAIMRKHLRGR